MAVKPISQTKFDSYHPARTPIAEVVCEETDWYADDAGNVIGAVVRDRTDNDWGYVILGRDEHGHFRCFDQKASIQEKRTARTELIAAMSKVEASGQMEFPQHDDLVP